jgi:GntR family histidine utilization transcriptional repressor
MGRMKSCLTMVVQTGFGSSKTPRNPPVSKYPSRYPRDLDAIRRQIAKDETSVPTEPSAKQLSEAARATKPAPSALPASFTDTTPRPLYQKVKEHIIAQTMDGSLVPGDRVPSEHELVRALGVSRMTANRALRELTVEGIVTRIPGVGTFVAEKQLRTEFLEIRNIADEIRARGHKHHSVLHMAAGVPAGPQIADALELPQGSSVFHTLMVHFDNDVAIQMEDRYVNPAAAPDYLSLDFAATTPNQYLTETAPITAFEHVVESVLPDATAQKLLKLRYSDPCLRLFRRTWSGDLVASCAWLTHPGRLYRMAARFPVAA